MYCRFMNQKHCHLWDSYYSKCSPDDWARDLHFNTISRDPGVESVLVMCYFMSVNIH